MKLRLAFAALLLTACVDRATGPVYAGDDPPASAFPDPAPTASTPDPTPAPDPTPVPDPTPAPDPTPDPTPSAHDETRIPVAPATAADPG